MANRSFKAGWATIDQTADPEHYVRFMDRFRGSGADDPATYKMFFDLIQPTEGMRVLEVGCGLGGATRALAKLVGPTGKVVGIDNSATMIQEATRRSTGLDLPVEFRLGDAHALPFEDETFDACWGAGVFEILDSPRQVFVEMVRVGRPGSAIVVEAPDGGMWAIDSPDQETTTKIMDYVCRREMNGWVGRQLFGWYKELGLTDIQVKPSTAVMADFEVLREFWLQGFVENAQAAGVVTTGEGTRWLAELQRRSREGRFFAALGVFVVTGRKPSAHSN